MKLTRRRFIGGLAAVLVGANVALMARRVEDLAAPDYWSEHPQLTWDLGDADVLADLEAAKKAIYEACGMPPDVIVMTDRTYYEVMDRLQIHEISVVKAQEGISHTLMGMTIERIRG